jgi:Ca2+-binding RTX toxin-like protein
VLTGGAGDDVLIGGAGNDTLDGGPGDNIVLDSAANVVRSANTVGNAWRAAHVRTVNGKTVLKFAGETRTLPHAHLTRRA